MPISSTADYIPVMDQFIAHWTATDDTLLVPENGQPVALDDFTDLRTALDGTKATLQARLNDLENARIALLHTRTTAGDRVAEFNRRIRAEFPDNRLFNKLPPVPNRTAGREAFISAMDDALDIWARVNAQPATPLLTAPLLLAGGLTHAQFATLRADVDAAFTTRANSGLALAEIRLIRDSQQDRAATLMKQYRLKIEALYAEDSVEVATLPRLTPLPGNTPDPVELTGEYNAAESRAVLTWTASTDADLADYQIRSVPGPEYSGEDETTLATIPPGGPLTFETATGFALPGNAVSYKVYVRLTTGNEAGSEPLTITRPL